MFALGKAVVGSRRGRPAVQTARRAGDPAIRGDPHVHARAARHRPRRRRRRRLRHPVRHGDELSHRRRASARRRSAPRRRSCARTTRRSTSTSSTRSRSSTTATCPVSPGDTERTYAQVEEALAPIVEAGAFAGGARRRPLDHARRAARARAQARPARARAARLARRRVGVSTSGSSTSTARRSSARSRRACSTRDASVQAGMRGSLYGAQDLQDARDLGFTVLSTDELRELGAGALRRARARDGRRAAGVRLVRHRLPRPGVRARHGHARGRAASRRRRRSRSCARCAASRSSAATSSRSRRRTTAPGMVTALAGATVALRAALAAGARG